MEFYRIDPIDGYSYQEEMEWLEADEIHCQGEDDGVDWQEFHEWCNMVDENAVNRELEITWQEEYARAYGVTGF